jgi:hypothetical protein
MTRNTLKSIVVSASAALALCVPLALTPARALADGGRLAGYDYGPAYYDITVRNATGQWLKVFVHYLTPSGVWNTRVYEFAPGQGERIDALTRNRIIYFRAEGAGYVANGGADGVVTSDGRRYLRVNMGPTVKQWTHLFH